MIREPLCKFLSFNLIRLRARVGMGPGGHPAAITTGAGSREPGGREPGGRGPGAGGQGPGARGRGPGAETLATLPR
jgi:hypothetical protein